jgi:hypothetical protein
MSSIFAYRKHYTAHTVITLNVPDNAPDPEGGEDLRCTELCTIEGVTYVSVPDGLDLPGQPAEIADSVQVATITPELRAAIKAASPHCRLIDERMQDRIRARYTPEDEMYFARIGAGAALGVYQFESGEKERLLAYGAHVEAVRQWGRSERAKLGF